VHSSADIPSQGRTLDSQEHLLSFRLPIVAAGARSAVLPKLAVGYRAQNTNAKFVGNQPTPPGLSEVTIGTDYLSQTARGNTLGITGAAGFKTDQLVKSIHDLAFETLVFYKTPSATSQATGLVYMGQFSNNRNYLNWIPLPGIAYYSAWRDKVSYAIGVPYASFRFAPVQEFRLEGSAQLFQSMRTQAVYSIESGEAFIVGFRWDHEGYLLSGRERRAERLIIEEKRVYGGFEAQIVRDFRVQIVAGILNGKKLSLRTSMFSDARSEIALEKALFGSAYVYLNF
jgi:hypothetical protein